MNPPNERDRLPSASAPSVSASFPATSGGRQSRSGASSFTPMSNSPYQRSNPVQKTTPNVNQIARGGVDAQKPLSSTFSTTNRTEPTPGYRPGRSIGPATREIESTVRTWEPDESDMGFKGLEKRSLLKSIDDGTYGRRAINGGAGPGMITRTDGSVVPLGDVIAERRKRSADIGNVSGQAPLSTSGNGDNPYNQGSQTGQAAMDVLNRGGIREFGATAPEPQNESFAAPAMSDTTGSVGDYRMNAFNNERHYQGGGGVASPQQEQRLAQAQATNDYYTGGGQAAQEPTLAPRTTPGVTSFDQYSPDVASARERSIMSPFDGGSASAPPNYAANPNYAAPLGEPDYSVMGQVRSMEEAKAREQRAKDLASRRQLGTDYMNSVIARNNAVAEGLGSRNTQTTAQPLPQTGSRTIMPQAGSIWGSPPANPDPTAYNRREEPGYLSIQPFAF